MLRLILIELAKVFACAVFVAWLLRRATRARRTERRAFAAALRVAAVTAAEARRLRAAGDSRATELFVSAARHTLALNARAPFASPAAQAHRTFEAALLFLDAGDVAAARELWIGLPRVVRMQHAPAWRASLRRAEERG